MNAQTEIAMTASVTSADLLKALGRVKTVIERRNTIPVLGMVKVAIHDGHCAIAGTNIDMWASAGCEGEGSVRFLIQPRLLEHMLRHGGPTIQIVQGADRVEVHSGDLAGRFNLLCPVEDWLEAGQGTFSKPVSIDAEVLRRAFEAVTPAISTEETRYYLNGSYFEATDDGLRVVATDGHRLALYDIDGQDWPFPGVIVPRQAVAWLKRELKGQTQVEVRHDADRNRLRFTAEGWFFETKLIDGNYPDYRRVIPKPDGTISVAVSGDALAALPVIEPHMTPVVKINPEKGRMSVTSVSTGEVYIPVTGKGPAFGLNAFYLRQFCPRGEAVRIDGTAARDPMLIIGADAALTRVLMPYHI